jgi:iron uptake system EfeUOB component EfeO/EfeM
MNESDFEGSLVLEKLAEIDKVEAFFDAIDADDFKQAQNLMTKAGLDAETIRIVLQKMADADGEH